MLTTADNRRSKMVTFRVSAEEYQSLEAACLSNRARSISELARAAVRQWIEVATASNPFDTELHEVERRIQVMGKELERLQFLVQLQRTTPGAKDAPQ